MRSWVNKRKSKKFEAKEQYVDRTTAYAWRQFGKGDHEMAAAILSGLTGYSTRSLGATRRRVWNNVASVAQRRGENFND